MSKVEITGNKGKNIGGDFIKVMVPKNTDLKVKENDGSHIKGNYLSISYAPSMETVEKFIADIKPYLGALPKEQQEEASKTFEMMRQSQEPGIINKALRSIRKIWKSSSSLIADKIFQMILKYFDNSSMS